MEIFKLNSSRAIRSYGLIDTRGKVIVEPKYDHIYSFRNGIARVSVDMKYGYINKTGKVLWKF